MNEFSEKIRHLVIELAWKKKTAHVGSSLSMCEILAAIYSTTVSDDDHVIISKGHAALAGYAALALTGKISMELLDTYFDNGSLLQGHLSHHVPGITLSTGSLGHALPVAIGLALAKPDHTHYVVLSDGELNEGANWEALLFAPKHIENIRVVIDYNKLQSLGTTEAVLDLEPLADKFRSFGWNVIEVDGHNVQELKSAFASPLTVVIAHTVKGKGIPEIENTLSSHYKPPTNTQYQEFCHAHSLPIASN